MQFNLNLMRGKVLVHNKSENSFRDQRAGTKSPLKLLPSLNEKHLTATSQFIPRKKTVNYNAQYSEFNDLEVIKLAKDIYEAKCKDLMILSVKDQEARFIKQFQIGISLRQLNLQQSSLSTETCQVLCKFLPNCSFFAYLNFAGNKLNDNLVMKIVKSLRKNNNLVSLNLSSTDITTSGSNEILENLGKFNSLVSLDLSSSQYSYKNRIGANEGLTQLLSIPTLVYLNLSDTGLNKKSLAYLIRGLKRNSVLRYLNLNSNKLKGIIFKDFCQALTNTNIEELLLASNKIEEIAMEELSDFFSGRYGFGVVSMISLASNCILTPVASSFLDVISAENYLSHLNLENNKFSGNLDVLYKLLVENRRLRTLNLSNCALGLENFYKLSEGLGKNNYLENLIVQKNNCGDFGAKALANALLMNKSLKKLDVSGNNIKNIGGLALVSSLLFNKAVSTLYISDNELKDEVGEALVKLFSNNFYIVQMKFELNPMTAKYSEEIGGFLDRNKKFNNEIKKKPAINLKKIVIEEDSNELGEENIVKKKFSQYLNQFQENEKLGESKINEVSRDSVEKIDKIKKEIEVGVIQNVYSKQKTGKFQHNVPEEIEEKSEI